MGVVLYKVVGHDILRFGVCMLLMMIFIPLAIFFATKRHGNVAYDYVPCLKGLWNKRVVKTYARDDNQWAIETILGIVCAGVAIAAAINSF